MPLSAYATVVPIEIVAGREGIWGIRNKNIIPLGGAVMLRNATMEDHTWRAGGGASKLGVSIPGIPTLSASIDYWPDVDTQRTVTAGSDGSIYKDDGTGNAWAAIQTGLTVAGFNPRFTMGGQEALGRARRLFYYDGINPVKVLAGDGVAMATIAAPPTDWTGTNQPLILEPHQGYMWGGGNKNNPHIAYRSLLTNHEDFTTTPYQLPVFPGEGERIVAMLSFKGLLLIWKYPEGVYAVETSDPTPANWRVIRVGRAGAGGPGCVVAVEDDVLWVSPDGSWHLISATQVTGSVHATDLAYRKLGSFSLDQINLSRLQFSQVIYYSFKKVAMLACSAQGQNVKNRCLHLDLNRQQDLGERWVWWDRDINESLYLRKDANRILRPAMGDNAGQVWNLDRPSRDKDGSAYTFEFFLADTDFGQLNPQFIGRKKNLRYLQLEFDPRSSATLAVELWLDGRLRQTVNFTLAAGGLVLPFTLPGTLGAETLAVSQRKRLFGRGIRIALRARSSILDADISITRLVLGVEIGE